MEPLPPIIADEHGDVNVFTSLSDAERYFEPIDIANEEYGFYDATGLVLSGEVHTEPAKGSRLRRLLHPPRQHVRIVVPAEADRRPDELAETLRGFLARVGTDGTGIDEQRLAGMSLDQLVAACGP